MKTVFLLLFEAHPVLYMIYFERHFACYFQVVMIGDDIVSDVGGAQQCGMRGVQVRTGKWR